MTWWVKKCLQIGPFALSGSMVWLIKFPLRALNAIIGWWWYGMEVAADWLVSFFAKSEYVRKGRCNQCGRCCRLLAVEMPRWIARRDRIVYLLSRWHSAVLNFEFEGRDDRYLVYHCRYYLNDEQGGHCRFYPFRHTCQRLP